MPAILEWAKRHWVWIAGAVAVVVVLIYLRNRAAGASSADTTGGGGGFGAGAVAGSAPASDTTGQSQLDSLQQQYYQQEIAHQGAMNQLQEQLGQVQLGIAQQTAGTQAGLINQINLTNAAHEKELGGASADFCPAGTSMRLDPNTGQYVCRNKSGGFAFIGQISSAIQNVFSGFTSGVASAAPGIGAGAANAAANYYTGRLFGPAVGQQAYAGSPQPGGGGTIVASPSNTYLPGQMSGGSLPPGVTGVAGPVSSMPIA